MSTFQEGYDFFAKGVGAANAALRGESYVQSLEREISQLAKNLHGEFNGTNVIVDKAKGFAAEHWHADTYNINAVLNGSTNRALVDTLNRGQLGSPDIIPTANNTALGVAGVKYFDDGMKSAKEQAKSLFERYKQYEAQAKSAGRTPVSFEEYQQKAPGMGLYDPLYGGQTRIIPKEQLEQATEYLKKKIAKESINRPEQAQRYQDTLNLLQDRLRDSDGVESIPLSKADAEKIARAAKEGKFDPKEFGLSPDKLITSDYIRTQAIQAGLSAAALTMALKTAPEIVKGIRHLIQTGEIDPEQLKKTGVTALSSGAEGYLRGMISAAVTISCKAGIWGQTLTSVSPFAVSGIVVFALDAIKGVFAVAIDKKDSQQFKKEIAEEAFSAVGAAVGGATLNTVIPGVGYMVGALLGSTLGSYAYHVATKTTTVDNEVAYFKEQALFFAEYLSKLLKLDLSAFKKITSAYGAVVDNVCTAKNDAELNAALKDAYVKVNIVLPWQGDFDTFMQDKTQHLVFS